MSELDVVAVSDFVILSALIFGARFVGVAMRWIFGSAVQCLRQ
jgi:hypothetical protein